MSMLDTVLKKRLAEGAHKATFEKYEDRKVEVMTDETNSVMRENIAMQLKLDDRTLTQVAFPSNLSYYLSCLRTQLQLGDDKDYTAKEILDLAVGKEIEIYITYTTEYGMNVAFHNAEQSAPAIEDVEV